MLEAVQVDDELWFRGSEREWRDLVEHQYWAQVSARHLDVERQFEHLDPGEIESLSTDEFFSWLHDQYFYWKYTSANRLATTRAALVRWHKEIPAGRSSPPSIGACLR